ncbi:MAG TPA: hypothetical protein VIT67_17050, partial [Povalibacter sp.]
MRLTPAIEFHRMSTLRVCMVPYIGFTVAQCAKGVDLLVLVSQGQVVQSFLAPSATPIATYDGDGR